MKLYRITALNTSHGQTPDSELHWVASKAEAASKRKELVASGFKRAEINTEEIDVPTDKKGLLGFLNSLGNV